MTQAEAVRVAPARQMWPLYAAGFTTAIGAHGIAANLGGFSQDAVTSLIVLGGLLALYDGAEVLLKPVFGTLADRIGARPVLFGRLVAFAAASALYVVADSPAWLWVARLGPILTSTRRRTWAFRLSARPAPQVICWACWSASCDEPAQRAFDGAGLLVMTAVCPRVRVSCGGGC